LKKDGSKKDRKNRLKWRFRTSHNIIRRIIRPLDDLTHVVSIG